MKAYISISYNKRKSMNAEINAIKETLIIHKIIPLVFVDEFKFNSAQEKEMMQQAMQLIDNSDVLIAEVSDKAIGIGIEVGYAKAKGKPVIYLRNEDAENSTTVSGISDFQILYNDVIELKQLLSEVISKIVRP
jgi:nucleoside 2-deoxyribosyltransferase